MGDPSAPPSSRRVFARATASCRGSGSALSSRGWRLVATLPFTLALALAGATLNASLAPTHDVGEDLRLKNVAPPAPAESSPVHHDEAVFDPTELISV